MAAEEVRPAIRQRQIEGGLRQRTARGTITNTVFVVGVAVIALVQRIVVAGLLTPEEFGIWALVLIALLTLLFVKNAGVSERYVQQDEENQELAFHRAFTIDLLLGLLAMALIAAALPLFALAYGHWDIVAPGLVLSLAVLGNSLQAPVWIFYRRMEFRHQRLLQAIEPGVTFVVTVTLAAAGAGYWSLVLGAVSGAWAGGLIACWFSPYRLRLRVNRETLRDYFFFSWPVVVANGSGVLIAQSTQLFGARTVGVKGLGGIALGASITTFSDGVDGVVTQTMYPAICAVKDKPDLLEEAFVKTNRAALMWGVPFGLAVVLFTPDLVHLVIGDRWAFAIHVVQAYGLVSAIDQLGFNWHAFLRATNQTRPLAAVGGISLAGFLLVSVPLLITSGLDGFAVGWIAWAVLTVTARTHYLRRLFPTFRMWPHALRSFLPAVPGVAAVLVMRQFSESRTPVLAISGLLLFVVITAIATYLCERTLIREALGYLRRR